MKSEPDVYSIDDLEREIEKGRAAKADLPRLMALTGEEQQRRHRVMILGGGLVGSRVADLMGKDVQVKIVEKDEERAAELCHRLNQ